MNARIEVSHDRGQTVFASFRYKGLTSSRLISDQIRKRINKVGPETRFRIIENKKRVCVWCELEPAERIEADDELGRMYYSDVLDAHGNRTA